MRKKAAVIISLILAMSFCFSTTSVYAKPLSELQEEIEQKQDELKKGKEKEKNLSSQINSLEKEIYQLNDQIEVSEVKLDKLKKDLDEAVAYIEKETGKAFVEAALPTPQEICTKQLYRVMDQIEKTDVNEEEIAPFMTEINRHFEYMEKEDLIKKIVSRNFGRFLAYYADAPVIEKPSLKGERKASERKGDGKGKTLGRRKAEHGYRRLFINLGKDDGFYPGEVMQFINKHVKGRQEVGHIDLMGKFSYIEVPEEDAQKVMEALDGTTYKNRDVRCNDADEKGHGGGRRDSHKAAPAGRGDRSDRPQRSRRSEYPTDFTHDDFGRFEKKSKRQRGGDAPQSRKGSRGAARFDNDNDTGDWRQFFPDRNPQLKGEAPDFSEEGWARRKPKKK